MGLLAYLIQGFGVSNWYVNKLFLQGQHISDRKHDIVTLANDHLLVSGKLYFHELPVLSYLLCPWVCVLYVPRILKQVFLLVGIGLVKLLHILAVVDCLALFLLVLLVVIFIMWKIQSRTSQIPCSKGYLALVQQRMLIYFLPLNTLFRVVNQTALDETHRLGWYVDIVIFWCGSLYVLKNSPVIHSFIWQSIVKHLVEHDPNGPNICTPTITMALMDLWGHSLVGTQLSHSQGLILEFLGKAQIGNLADMVVQQDIG